MQGEAYFEVESDKEHPFIVKTKQLTVGATGTAFNVNAYAPDHVAAVTLVKGKVAVTLDQKKTISLSPGEKIDYNLATSLYNVNKTNTYNGAHGKMEYSYLEMTRWNMYSSVWDRLITWNLF